MRERAQLTLKDVSVSYGDRSVLEQISFTVRPGEKAAVIGENGSGKSTLLRLVAGVEPPGRGEVTVRFPGGVARLAQTPAETFGLGPGAVVRDAVDAALAGLRALEREMRAAEERLGSATPDELLAYGELAARFEERGGYTADAEVAAALSGLGLGGVSRERRLGTLSGGERARLALACVLASGAELLLLDEPTNHLDRAAADWLAERLRGHRGTVVTVTHDRDFLERVSTTVLEVDRDTRSVIRYGDGWAGYRAAKAAELRRRAREHEEWREELARTEELVASAGQRLAGSGKDPRQGFGKHRRSHENKLSGQVRTARTRLDQLRRAPVPAPPEPLRFTARLRTVSRSGLVDGEAGRGGRAGLPPGSGADGHAGSPGPLVELADVVVGRRLRIEGLRIAAGERLLVSGPNGAGKTTLLRVLAGELRPDRGTVVRAGGIGYLRQEPPAVPASEPLLTAYAAGRPGLPEEHAEELSALGLFRVEDLAVPVARLSVGQRRRLELARLVTRPADLLVLDEPTNHVTLSLVEELEAALAVFPGAVVAVSHDRRFRSGFGGGRLELRGGRVA
ncbi:MULTISPECIES: ABC-F family ATP-binding cassette domain-containing protein [unclassified Streptomyces]|uniref:ABC-F family ATP-binding cassette domain-containing protein n=1 Tax=unclassified Streptomyces TaxID=2593676 RepID=UPI00166074AE|nr:MULTISPECIES: ABC-F family ATP-binding cassette domain-containing protein [unclassified Streptomyces]MBD0711718.1 ABC transporter ATP-binding protein [Streptomyces sp. CBMA291]MBD0713872.1 ABC transporter ATP-binding protein [Streptomyces sp. CBMA370]